MGPFDEPLDKCGLVISPTADDLLDAFAPELRYDDDEHYFADSAAEMTDNLSPSPHYFNALKFPTGDVIAAADPAEPFADLSLSFLGLTYSSGMPASASDYIDAETDFTYSLDAARMHALPQYGDRVYGRLVTYPDGQKILQYWFFYYYNSKDFSGIVPGAPGVHEGDWEGIQLLIDVDGTPLEAAYNSHEGARRCPWSIVERTPAGRPVVYVAEGSHASYFTQGEHPLDGYPTVKDFADAGGPWVVPAVEDF